MITVFTPTYNRCYIIDQLYQSLLRQTNMDFEWVVVDDGSTDDTAAYFQTILKNDNPFSIRYVRKENGGKHKAINVGLTYAAGELFFIVDSDDHLTDDAIQKLHDWRAGLDGSHKWAGISGARGYSTEKLIGKVHDKGAYVDCKNTERKKYQLIGDKAEAYFTAVLQKHPFPEFEGEKFLTEEVVWNAIAADGYYLRWFRDIIYICDYLEDGLTKDNTKNKKNPNGVLAWAKGQIKAFPHNLAERTAAVCVYYDTVCDTKSTKVIAEELSVSVAFVQIALTARKLIKTVRKCFVIRG